MRDDFERQYETWGVDALLARYRGLALVPHDGTGMTIAGDLAFIEDLRRLFGVTTDAQCMGMLLLASLQKRKANPKPCPCGSMRRLGACHNRMLNKLRKRCGRLTFRDEYLRVRQADGD